MRALLRRDTNRGFNYLALMVLAGGIAAIGLLTDTLHVVIGAILVAPGFEPFVRIAFGIPEQEREDLRMGLRYTAAGYFGLAAGAVAVGLAAKASPSAVPNLEDLAVVSCADGQ